MADIIKRDKFDSQLAKLQEFSKHVPSIPTLSKFEVSGGLFGWGNHYINGNEMNQYVSKVQDIFKEQQNVLIKTIKEFEDVYNTFKFLDSEYLSGIKSASDEAAAASHGAKEASKQAKTTAEMAIQLAIQYEEILKLNVENLKKVVDKIKLIRTEFTNKASDLEDVIIENTSNLEIAFKTINRVKSDFSDKISDLEDIIATNASDLEKVIESKTIPQDELKKLHEGIEMFKEYPSKIDELSNTLNDLSEQLSIQNSKYSKRLIISYIVGSLGVISSIVSILVSCQIIKI
jgi:hypothetical protein